jgi:outer membrane protein OmpA-like peptidoglycan-associated protein
MKTKLFFLVTLLAICTLGLFAQSKDDWAAKKSVLKNNAEGDLIIRVGDIDNFGFGWPEGYNPYSGEDTPGHGFPWDIDQTDPQGTDRIFIGTSYKEGSEVDADGYTGSTKRPDNLPQPITLEYSLEGVNMQSAMLELFVDDFQAQAMNSYFQVKINGQRIPYFENIINALDQTGPIGKMIYVQLLPEHLALVKTGKLVIEIDDPTTGVGDGFAIDFVRLLINPKPIKYVGTVKGKVVDAQTEAPIAGALVSASNIVELTSNASGEFTANNVPAGIASITVSKSGYYTTTQNDNLVTGAEIEMTIKMKKLDESVAKMTEEIDKKGQLVLYGINFETGTSNLTQKSIAVLEQIVEVMKQRPNLKIEVGGHTDADGDAQANIKLSQDRAQHVVDWLVAKGVASKKLIAKGYGSSSPIASNKTEEGKAANRRVELKVIKE